LADPSHAIAMAAPDLRHVLDANDTFVDLAHNGSSQLVEILEFVECADQIDRAEILHGPTGTVDVFLAQRLGQVVERQSQRRQTVLVGFYLDFRIEPAAHLGGGHTGHGLQARFEPTLGDPAQLVERTVAA